MGRRRNTESADEIITKILFLLILTFVGAWYFDSTHAMLVSGSLILLFLLSFGLRVLYLHNKNTSLNQLFETVRDDLQRFVHRNGRTSGNIKIGTYKFSNTAIETVRDELSKRHDRKISTDEIKKLIHKAIDSEERETVRRNTFTEEATSLQSLSGTEFEELLGRLFSEQGFQVTLNGRSGDQGADLILSKDGARTAVQAKRYQKAVNNSAIQEAVAAKAVHDCSFAMVVTTSFFTKGAFENGLANGVTLMQGKELRKQLYETLGEAWV